MATDSIAARRFRSTTWMTDRMTARTPLLLLILDGWGVREPAPDNAISTADTPNWDRLWSDCPHALLDTSGEAVGLPDGQMGNSEVGHMNIGAGRIVYQDFTRITRAIREGSFRDNAALNHAMTAAPDSTLHLIGLLSPGGVHSHEDHLLALLERAAEIHPGPIAVHAILDGRDMPPRSAAGSLRRLQAAIDPIEQARIATVCGRYYAMDRDNRWDRVQKAWNAIVEARAEHTADAALDALQAAYARDENDEFVEPTLLRHANGAGAAIQDGDAVIWFNFRADRARQFCRALVEPGFDGFEADRPSLAAITTMTSYLDGLPVDVAFPPERMDHLLGGELAEHGMTQLRIAETEKYAHVTYFFNGGEEQVFEREDRILIPSPDVATYDLQPEMSAPELTERLVEALRSGRYDVIICNVANPDMVGHSGIFDAAVAAAEAVDRLLGSVVEAIDEAGGELLVTADHGNVEQMADPETGQAHTAHTTNPVPLVHFGRAARMEEQGSLRDIAPTMLQLLDLPVPSAMTGRPLVHPDE
jgi:2,3-bisphosphoglycerate-independent phosphoglycerate mutase